MIPCIDIHALFSAPGGARDQTDAEFLQAAEKVGFIQVRDFGENLDVAAGRREALKRIFTLRRDSIQAFRQQARQSHEGDLE